MAPAIEFVGCAWLQHGCLSRNLAGGSRGRVGITVYAIFNYFWIVQSPEIRNHLLWT